MGTVRFYTADLITGAIRPQDDVLRLKVADLEHMVGGASTAQATLPIKQAPPGWPTLLSDPRTMIVAVLEEGPRDNPTRSTPLVGYRILTPVTGNPELSLNLGSLETCFDDIKIVDSSYSGDEGDTAAALINQVAGPVWGFDSIAEPTGRTADHDYSTDQYQSLTDALTALMGVKGGPEWTARIRWATTDRRRFVKEAHTGPRVGTIVPDVVVNGSKVNDRLRTVDFSDGKFATIVTATADGDSVTVTAQDLIDAGYPPAHVVVPVAIPDDVADPTAYLNRYAERALAQKSTGMVTWEMVLKATHPACPVVGVDFVAGDTVRIDLEPNQYDPVGWTGLARLVGWRATIGGSGAVETSAPVIYDDRDENGVVSGDLPASFQVRSRNGIVEIARRLSASEADRRNLQVVVGNQSRRIATLEGPA